MDEVQGTHSPRKPRGHPGEHCPACCHSEVTQVLGTLCPGWPQGGSGHLCPQDCPQEGVPAGQHPRVGTPLHPCVPSRARRMPGG